LYLLDLLAEDSWRRALSYASQTGIAVPHATGCYATTVESTPTQTVGPKTISPPPSWADADDLAKRSRERRLICKAYLVRDLG
jgi:hypothetical protein